MQVSPRFFAWACGLCLLLVLGIWFWPAASDPTQPDSTPGREPAPGVELPPEWDGIGQAPPSGTGADPSSADPARVVETRHGNPSRRNRGAPTEDSPPREPFDLIAQGFTVLDAAAEFAAARSAEGQWQLRVLAGEDERKGLDEKEREKRRETRKKLDRALGPISKNLMVRPTSGMEYLAMLDAASPEAAFAAATPLRYSRSSELVAELARRLTQAPEAEARLFALQGLIGRGDVAAARAVQAATVDPVPQVRAAAQLAVGGFLSDSSLGSLRPGLLASVRSGLGDPDPVVRRQAILALNGLAPQPDLQPVLEGLAADQAEPTVAAVASRLLRHWADKAE